MLIRQLWHVDAHRSEIRSVPGITIPSDVCLKSLFSLISMGTERIIASGKVPATMYNEMKVPYMQGDFSFPVQYGYSLVGQAKDGSIYHMMHPHQDHVCVKSEDITLIPHTIPPPRATLISNLETACTAYWDARVLKNDRILVVGFGMIGALTAGWLAMQGHTKVAVLEPNTYRSKMASQLGFEVISENDDNSYTLAFHCSATGEGLQACIQRLDLEGRIIDTSWYGDKSITIHLGHRYHFNRLSLRSSQVSHIPEYLSATQSPASRKKIVIDVLQDTYWDKFLDQEISLDQAVIWFDAIRAGTVDQLCVLIKY